MFVGCFRCSKTSHSCREAGGQEAPVQTSGPTFLLCPQLWAPTRHSGCSSSWTEICLPEARRQPSHHQHMACPVPWESTVAPAPATALPPPRPPRITQQRSGMAQLLATRSLVPQRCFQPQAPAVTPEPRDTTQHTQAHSCMHAHIHTTYNPPHTHTHTHWISFRNLTERSHPKYAA